MKRPRTIALLVLLLALAGTAAVLCGLIASFVARPKEK